MVYQGFSEICNTHYKDNATYYIFLPYRLDELRASDSSVSLVSESSLSQALERQIGQAFDAATEECQELFSAVVCNSLFFTINSSSSSSSDSGIAGPLCPDECQVVMEMCPKLWETYLVTELGRDTSCGTLGRILDPVPYCCHDGGIVIPTPSQRTPEVGGSNRGDTAGIAAGVTVAIVVLLVIVAVAMWAAFVTNRKFKNLRTILHGYVRHTHKNNRLNNL